jgi:2'-5' RNA ligase
METAVIIPVPEAAPTVARHRWTHDPTSALGIPEHITLLGPFVEPDVGVERALANIFATAPAFAFQLARTGWFGNQVLYLAPEPAAPFIALTHRLVAKFGVKPYRGEFADVIPHLTVAQESGTSELEAQLLPALPIDARAVEAWLMVQPVAEGGWIRHLRLPLTRT